MILWGIAFGNLHHMRTKAFVLSFVVIRKGSCFAGLKLRSVLSLDQASPGRQQLADKHDGPGVSPASAYILKAGS